MRNAMRLLQLGRLIVAATILTGAAQSAAAQTPPPKTAPAKTPAQATSAKEPRTIEITGTDDMKWSVTTIEAKAGETIRIRLKSVGTMPKVAMAHNFVLLKLGTDQIAFTNAAAPARATDFIPPAMKDKVLATTGLAGNGETVETTFKVPTARGKYPYVCTFPGHFVAGMKGTLVVK
jgi:azurin